MTSSQRKTVIGIIALVAAALAIYAFLTRGRTTTQPATKPAPEAPAAAPIPEPVPLPPPAVKTAPASAPAERARAASLMEQGLQLAAAGKPVAARSALADALNTGALPPAQAGAVREKLVALVQETLLSHRKYPDDPCVVWYKFKFGEKLARIERTLKLHVPTQLLLKINGIADARTIQAGQTLKLIRGPFHAIISKGAFALDLYLEEAGTRRLIFVRRLKVGVGKDGTTPVGRWRVAKGKKMDKAAWTPPVTSKLPRRKVLWGEKDYPLGKKGYWIALEGIEGNIYTAEDGYGIHGTDDSDSIGRASSLGCIRLVDHDIELVFATLYEYWSTVTVRQ